MSQVDNQKEYNQLAGIAANLPIGVCKISLDGDYSLIYANECYYDLQGYTPEQMEQELKNQVLLTVLPEDVTRVKTTITEAKASGQNGFDVESRLVRRDGTVLWGWVSGTFTQDDGQGTADCAVMDITARIKIEQELRINEERFRLALSQMDNTIFDYNIATRVMIHAYKPAEMYAIPNEMHNVPDSLVANGSIHPDSVDIFLGMYQKIRDGEPKASCIVLARLAEGRYVWRRITLTNIFDNEGTPVHAVGILEDIDDQKRREEFLRDQSERDPLTGLYNRRGTELRIRQCLSALPTGATNGLLVIDIDHFKGINDRYGHLYGDRVLDEAARRMAVLFCGGEIIGRIGGDEFMVFVQEWKDAEKICEGAQKICGMFGDVFESRGISAQISCSVGIAIIPKDGTAFEELYQKADIALYEAKKNGKNQICLYEPGMGSDMEWVPYSNTKIDEEET